MKMQETLIETFSFIADNNPNTKDGGRSFRDAVTGGNVLDPPPSPIDEKQFPPLMDMNKHLGKPLPQRRVSHQSRDQGMSQGKLIFIVLLILTLYIQTFVVGASPPFFFW